MKNEYYFQYRKIKNVFQFIARQYEYFSLTSRFAQLTKVRAATVSSHCASLFNAITKPDHNRKQALQATLEAYKRKLYALEKLSYDYVISPA